MKSTLTLLLGLLLFSTLHAQVPAYVPTDGLVGWWPFNGNANDDSGNGNYGVVNGATLTDDRFGNLNNAFQFDGDDKIQTLFSGPTGSGISLSFWYKTSEVQQMQTISYGSTQWGGYFGAYLNHYAAQTSGPCYGPALTNAGTLVNKGSDVYPDPNAWHHSIIIIPTNASDLNDVIFYLDGVLLSGACSFANYGAPSPNINDGNPIIFGGGWYSGFPYNDFTGKLDDIAFYNRALTEQEIQNLYAGTTPAACNALPANLQTGLVGYWPFCGNANDESGNGNDGVVNGATLTEDRFGNAGSAYSFDGSTVAPTYISGDCSNFPTASRTVSLWFYANDIGSTTAGRALLGYGGGICGQSWLMNIDNPNNGGNVFEVQGHCQNEQLLYNYGDLDPNGSWYHWLVTTDTDGTKFYLNGELVQENDIFIDQTVVNGRVFIFGGMSSNNGLNYLWDVNAYPFNGSLDDIAIWSRALTPAEVQELYTGQPVTPPVTCTPLPSNLQTGLVGYWPFCGSANDESGNGNDGVVNGATLTEDRFGNANAAYGFDGGPNLSADRIICNNPLINDSDFSFSFWLRNESISPDWTVPLMIQGNNSSYEFYFNQDSISFANFDLQQATINAQLTFGNSANIESFNNYCFSYDGSELKFYLNGNYSSSFSTSNLITPFDGQLFIGKHCCFLDDMPTGFKGDLDDIAIYNRALTSEEVQELYTLDACTFTVYDTLTVENIINVYDTLTIENIVDIYDTTYINVEVYDTLTVENVINVYDTLTIENVIDVFDTTTVVETVVVFDTLTVENVIDVFDTTTVVETVVVFDTLTVENVIDVFDTTTVVETVVVFDTLTVENVIDVYDTTYVTVTDTLIIDIPSGVGGTILNTLLLYPNPTSDQLTINYGNFAAMAGYSLSIFDNGGSTVHETTITQSQETLDITQWSAGVYQVVVSNAGGVPVETRQIVIQ